MAPYATCNPTTETPTEVDPHGSFSALPASASGAVLRERPQIIRLSLSEYDLKEGLAESLAVDFGPPREDWVPLAYGPPHARLVGRGYETAQAIVSTEDADPDYHRAILQAVRRFAEPPMDPVPAHTELRRDLLASLEDEPIEDGYSHPGEGIVRDAIDKVGSAAFSWLESVYSENVNRPSICAGILRCVGRQPYRVVDESGAKLARRGLAHADSEVREAAVRAFESWGGPDALSALEAHSDPVGWLADYIKQVIADLSG